MQITVGTAATRLVIPGSNAPVIQNLGPGNLYVDHDSTVTTATGLKLAVGDVYEFPRDLNQGTGECWLVADAANTDVRYLVVG